MQVMKNKDLKPMRKMSIWKKVILTMIGSLLFLVISGFVFEAIAGYYGVKQFPPGGKLVDAGGFKLHLQKHGEGGPTIILEGGGGESSNVWLDLPEELSSFATVVEYDRAGYAWSEGTSTERTGENIVKELYTALKNENIEGPYILVGHSLGGMYARLFAQTYTDEVAGIILLDSRHEDYSKETNQYLVDKGIDPITLGNPSKEMLSLLKLSGVLRLMSSSLFADIPEEDRDLYLNIEARPKSFYAQENELKHMDQLEDSIRNQSLGDIPLTIVTHGKPLGLTALGMSEEDADIMEEIWSEQQEQTRKLSTDSELIIATNSGHAIMHDEPELVIDIVKDMVEKIK